MTPRVDVEGMRAKQQRLHFIGTNPDSVLTSELKAILTQLAASWGECLSEIERLTQNQRTEFSIEQCSKCGIVWDGEWPEDKCYWRDMDRRQYCPIAKSIRQAPPKGDGK